MYFIYFLFLLPVTATETFILKIPLNILLKNKSFAALKLLRSTVESGLFKCMYVCI